MKIDANVIDRIVAKTIYGVEWWDYIGAEVSDDQWRLMMMGRLAGISEFANALKEVLNADCKDEPLICDGNCWMKKQNGEWLCEYCQRKPTDEPQTERSE